MMHSAGINMTLVLQEQVPIKYPMIGYLPDPSKALVSSSTNTPKQNRVSLELKKGMDKQGNNMESFLNSKKGKLRQKITETVKGKLRLGAKILQMGGINSIFKRFFSVRVDEKILKACQCYLSTTAGPLLGLLFISTHKIAFCSQKSIKISSPEGETARVHYKVSIPLTKIKRVNQSPNTKKPSEKYVEVVTVDDFDFWFLGFLNHKKAFNSLHQALS